MHLRFSSLHNSFYHGDTENTEKNKIVFSVFSVSPWLVFGWHPDCGYKGAEL
jgi:hypothetical protein